MGVVLQCRLAAAGGLAFSLVAGFQASASEIPGVPPPGSGIVVHSADEVLAAYCFSEGGRLTLRLPSGLAYELVTDIGDPAIANQGDGRFHPMSADEVRGALAAIGYPLQGIAAEVFILPYPRRAGLESAAGPGLVLLSPGVREVPREQVHAEVAHEVGHVVHHALLPDRNREGWERYRALRGIADESLFNAWAPHAWRPHEIFAEDFRALFGGALANYSGTLENEALTPPAAVAGLREFLVELAGGLPGEEAYVYPNPTRGAARFVVPAAIGGTELDLFDAAGRRVRALRAVLQQGGAWHFQWNGRNQEGRPVAPGAYFARPRNAPGVTVRLAVVAGR